MKLSQDDFSNFANLPVTKTYSKNYRQTKETVEESDDYEKTIGKMSRCPKNIERVHVKNTGYFWGCFFSKNQ